MYNAGDFSSPNTRDYLLANPAPSVDILAPAPDAQDAWAIQQARQRLGPLTPNGFPQPQQPQVSAKMARATGKMSPGAVEDAALSGALGPEMQALAEKNRAANANAGGPQQPAGSVSPPSALNSTVSAAPARSSSGGGYGQYSSILNKAEAQANKLNADEKKLNETQVSIDQKYLADKMAVQAAAQTTRNTANQANIALQEKYNKEREEVGKQISNTLVELKAAEGDKPDRPTSQRVGMALAVALGELGRGLARTGSNTAAQIVEASIHREMQQRIDTRNGLRGMLQELRGQMGDLKDRQFSDSQLIDLKKISELDKSRDEFDKLANQHEGTMLGVEAKRSALQLDRSSVALKMQLADKRFGAAVEQEKLGIAQSEVDQRRDAAALHAAQNMQQLPSGLVPLRPLSQTQIELANKHVLPKMAGYNELRGLLQRAEQLAKLGGTASPAQRAEAQQLQRDIINSSKAFEQFGAALTPSEKKNIDIENPRQFQFFLHTVLPGIVARRKNLENRMSDFARTYDVGIEELASEKKARAGGAVQIFEGGAR